MLVPDPSSHDPRPNTQIATRLVKTPLCQRQISSCERFADFYQRFFGKTPSQKTPDTGITSIRVAKLGKRLPRGPPHEIGHLCCARPTPRPGDPLDFLIPPQEPINDEPATRVAVIAVTGGGDSQSRGGGIRFASRKSRKCSILPMAGIGGADCLVPHTMRGVVPATQAAAVKIPAPNFRPRFSASKMMGLSHARFSVRHRG